MRIRQPAKTAITKNQSNALKSLWVHKTSCCCQSVSSPYCKYTHILGESTSDSFLSPSILANKLTIFVFFPGFACSVKVLPSWEVIKFNECGSNLTSVNGVRGRKESRSADNMVLHHLQWLLLLATAQISVMSKYWMLKCAHTAASDTITCSHSLYQGHLQSAGQPTAKLGLGKPGTSPWFMSDTGQTIPNSQAPLISQKQLCLLP